MKRSWTRRRFLTTAAAGSLAATTGAASSARAVRTSAPTPTASPSSFSAVQRATLAAAAEEIVPAGEGMPGAAEVGALRYLEDLSRRDADVRRDLARAAAALSRAARPKRFAALASERRVAILSALEAREPAVFAALRDLVYEGYYANADVWRRLGFEFYGPARPGPGIAAFDEKSLAGVRARGPLYRRPT